jgi:hypothetical protein
MSNTTGKVKFYRNPSRNKPNDLKPYVPQYQLLGLDPEEYHGKNEAGVAPVLGRKAPLSRDNPRAPRPLIQQPYAAPLPSPIGRGRGLLPNVGNNMEQTWSSVDGGVIDDMNLDQDQEMLDNNEFVSAAALGLSEEELMQVEEEDLPEPQTSSTFPVDDIDKSKTEELRSKFRSFLTKDELQNALKEEYLSAVLQNLEEEEYLLVVNGSSVCSGPLAEVQEQTRGLVFGEHPLCGGNPMPIDDIIILKRVKIKIGLFLE